MADTKLSALPAASALGAGDLVYGDQSATSVKITTAQIKTFTSSSPTLVTPALGTPSSGNLSSCTGYATASLSGLGTGVATFLATPSSANLATAVADGTGTGATVFGTSPTISAPTISGHPTVEGVTSTGATGTGKFVFDTAPTLSGSITIGANGFFIVSGRSRISSAGDSLFSFANNGSTSVAPVQIIASNSWRHGSSPSATPVAQALTVGEDSRAGSDTNVAGSSGTISSGAGTGTGAVTTLFFKTPALGSSGSAQQTLTTRLTLGLSAVFGSAAIATTATDGFVYIPTCAGTPTGVPTSNTGRVALVYDTTNDQFWIYNGSWKQPKTPAAAAIVNWQ